MFKKKSPMKFQKLEIERGRFGADSGKLIGKVQFESDNSTVFLKITEEHVQKVMDLCADLLIETTKEMAEIVRNDIIEGVTVEKRIGRS